MKKSFWIATLHLLRVTKDKNTYILFLALPLVLTLITGMVFGGGSSEVYNVPLAVVDEDMSYISEYVIEQLDADNISLELYSKDQAQEEVEKKNVSAAVIIPYGFASGLEDRRPVELEIITSDLSESPHIARKQVENVANRVRANSAVAYIGMSLAGGDWQEYFNQAVTAWEPVQPVSVNLDESFVVRDDSFPVGTEQSSPGYLVMFGMMTVIVAGATSLLEERQNSTLARLLMAPQGNFHILTGKTLGLMASGIIQMSIMIIAGQYLFNVNWGHNLPAVMLLVTALSFAATGFGMMLASLCRTRPQAESFGVMSVVIMSMIGGTWWPVNILPEYMQIAAKFVPSGWAMEGFIDLILRGAGIQQILLPLGILVAFGVVFLSVGIKFFRYQ